MSKTENIDINITLNDVEFSNGLNQVLGRISNAISKAKNKTLSFTKVFKNISSSTVYVKELEVAINKLVFAKLWLGSTTSTLMKITKTSVEVMIDSSTALYKTETAVIKKTMAVYEAIEAVSKKTASTYENTQAILENTTATQVNKKAVLERRESLEFDTEVTDINTTSIDESTAAMDANAEAITRLTVLIEAYTAAKEALNTVKELSISNTKVLERIMLGFKIVKEGLALATALLKGKKLAATAVIATKGVVTKIATAIQTAAIAVGKFFAIAIGVVVLAVWALVAAFAVVVNLLERLHRLFGRGNADEASQDIQNHRDAVDESENAIGESMENINRKVREGFQEMQETINTKMSEIASTITGNISDITAAFDSLTESLHGVGENAMLGFRDGILSKIPAIMTVVSHLSNAVLQRIKAILQINSPSRAMRDIGGYTIDGYTSGMEDKQKDVEDVAESTADTVIDELDKASKAQNKLQSITSKLADTKNKYADQAAAMMKAGLDSAKSMAQNMDKMLYDNKLDQKLALAVTPPDADYQTSLMEKLICAVEAGKNIVMDSGELVGATYGGYDAAAGEAILYNSRWGR